MSRCASASPPSSGAPLNDSEQTRQLELHAQLLRLLTRQVVLRPKPDAEVIDVHQQSCERTGHALLHQELALDQVGNIRLPSHLASAPILAERRPLQVLVEPEVEVVTLLDDIEVGGDLPPYAILEWTFGGDLGAETSDAVQQ